jgi:plastocyanin
VDPDGIERVAPKTLTVSQGDKVIWANNLSESYTAQDFTYQGTGDPGQLFPANSYPMPPNGQSNSAQVQISQTGSFTFQYNCINGSGEMLDPVIIVDNPGTGDGDGSQVTKPRGKGRKPTKGKAKPKGKKATSKKATGKKSKAGKRR